MTEPNKSETPDAKSKITGNHFDGLKVDVTGEDAVDKELANLEMAGEEVAAGWKPQPHEPLSPEVRYLHVSRTIHQLITDRNRSVGIFLFMASLFFGASTALLNVKPDVTPIVPLRAIQYWCLPVTFGTLAVIGAFMALILIRTRIGLIYEVAKMNALLGLPAERVKRVNPLSIFFLMHALVVTLSGASAGLTVMMLMLRTPAQTVGSGSMVQSIPYAEGTSFMAVAIVALVMFFYLGLFEGVYYITILNATTDTKLQKARV